MAHRYPCTTYRVAIALGLLLPFIAPAARAQDVAAAAAPASAASGAATLAPVLITGKSPPQAGVAGWGDAPLAQTPVQATVVDARQLRDAGSYRLADLVRFDPSVNDAYNSEGYIDYFTIRGFVIDNRFNFRRDGLPINAETSIPLDNKARVDVLEGLSGIVAGTSSPGGLIDVIVKRPLDAPLSSAFVQWREKNSVLGSIDLSRRFGVDNAFGLRLNAAAEHLDPYVRDDVGSRRLLALAGDWRLGSGTLIEAEVETSHKAQPTQPGFSMLGNILPAPGDPRINLNNQPWSLPTVFDADTASLRITQKLNDDWRIVAHGVTQRLRTDDRTAFPFGCTAADGTYFPDRYCPDGTFDLYDFRSEDERRRSDALDLSVHGRFASGPLGHTVAGGVLRNVVHNRFNAETYNFAGTGNVEGTAVVPPAPDALDTNTNRDEYSTELYLRDAIAIDTRTTLWLGARHTRIARSSVATDGTSPTQYSQSFTTPFAAATYALWPGQIVYASWGQSVQSDVAPNLPRYINAGQAAPTAKSRQTEIGFKGASEQLEWTVAAFDIKQPLFGDLGTCVAGPDDPAGLHPHPRRRPAPHRPGGERHLAAGPVAAARCGAGAACARRRPGRRCAQRQAPDQRAGAQRARRCELRRGRPARPGRPGRGQLRERARRAARQQRQHPLGDALRSRRAPRAPRRRRGLDPARRRRQPLRSARLARIALPVQPRVLVPAGAQNVSRLAAGRPLSRPGRRRPLAIIPGSVPR